jgi:iron complex transport system permease protein
MLSYPRSTLVAIASGALLLTAMVHTLGQGSFDTTPWRALELLIVDDGSQTAFVIRDLRLPRALVAALVGAALAMAGLIVQTVMRNPLGDPGLMGVSSGASFAVATTLIYVAGNTLILMPAGVAGGVIAAAITLRLARHSGFAPLQLTLAGMAVSIFFVAATSAVILMNRTALQTLYFWLIGGFINRTWTEFFFLWPWVLAGLACGMVLARRLDLLQFEDDVSRALGARAAQWRVGFLVLAVVLTAASVAAAGPIGFIGFAVPHLTRWLTGSEAVAGGHALLLPMVALNGATLTSGTDALVRSGILDKQLPAGVLTSFMGGLLLLVFLRRARRT